MDLCKQLRLDAEIDRFAEESLLRLGITVLFAKRNLSRNDAINVV